MYSGQLDIVVGPPLTDALLQSMDWHNKVDHESAPKEIWRIKPEDPVVAGYVRQVHNFCQVVKSSLEVFCAFKRIEPPLPPFRRGLWSNGYMTCMYVYVWYNGMAHLEECLAIKDKVMGSNPTSAMTRLGLNPE